MVEELLKKAAEEQKEALKDPPPRIVFEDFGDNALVFDLFFWCRAKGERELRLIRGDIRFRIEALFGENGIVIAFPQRDVHFHAKNPIEVTMKPS